MWSCSENTYGRTAIIVVTIIIMVTMQLASVFCCCRYGHDGGAVSFRDRITPHMPNPLPSLRLT